MQRDSLVEACKACVVHARHLIESARLVQSSGRANIAYHLATLALEELGRRELFKAWEMSNRAGDEPAWLAKAMQDHVRKLFWCFYSLGNASDAIDYKQFLGKSTAAADIHANRLSGLYVESNGTNLNIPANAISDKQSDALIKLAESITTAAEAEQPRDTPHEELELQMWLLNAFDTPELRRQILSAASLESLTRASDIKAWARRLRADIETSEAQLKELVEAELRKGPGHAHRERWRIRLKLRTTSHTIRPKPLKSWNEKVRWIKFQPQQGALSKEELIADIILGANVPMSSLGTVATSISIQLVMALNLATSGFWWWPMAPNQERSFEKIRDLEQNLDVVTEDQSFKVITSKARLTDTHMDILQRSFSALPNPQEDRSKAYEHYLEGLTFMAVNCVQWRCEPLAFASFVQAFMLLMREAQYTNDSEFVGVAAGRFINEKFPDLDPPEFEKLMGHIQMIVRNGQTLPRVELADVYFLKLLCETIFRDSIMNDTLKSQLRA